MGFVSPEEEPEDLHVDGMSYQDMMSLLNTESFIVSLIMSELDVLMYKSHEYKKLAKKTLSKRTALAARVELVSKGISSFPDIMSRNYTVDPAQMSDANAILTEESVYTQLRELISLRYHILVKNVPLMDSLRDVTTFGPAEHRTLKAALNDGIILERKRELIEGVKKVEMSIAGDSRREIREHLYGTVVVFANNARALVNTLRFNYMLMGPPGSGKSFLALSMSQFFGTVGIFVRKELANVKKPDLVASYVGQSAGKTRRTVYSSLEGVLFLDEVYFFICLIGICFFCIHLLF
jgi:hypothetical protein